MIVLSAVGKIVGALRGDNSVIGFALCLWGKNFYAGALGIILKGSLQRGEKG